MFIVIRSYYRYGNEGDYIDCTFKEFETLDKAKAYAQRYAKGIKFVRYQIENEKGDVIEEYSAGN